MVPENTNGSIVCGQEYARQIAKRTRKFILAGTILVIGILGIVITAYVGVIGFMKAEFGSCVLVFIFDGGIAFLTLKWGLYSFYQIKPLDVVLVTRANASSIAAREILVRASEQPVQEEQTILLRPSAEQNRIPANQLLRPINDKTVGVNTLRS